MSASNSRIPRLFLQARLGSNLVVELDRDRSNYLRNVLRLGAGAPVSVFNGQDGEWRARLVDAGRRQTRLTIETRTRPQTAPGDLAYGFAPVKAVRLDYLVQKAVELGASVLSPVITRRTQVARVNGERMRANVVEAAEQCGILHVPVVEEPVTLLRWLDALAPERLLVFCDEEAETSDPVAALSTAPAGPVTVLVGPEGGFDEVERRMLLARPRTLQLSLGPRTLRADTAAVAALALVQAVRGDWR